MTIRLRRPTRDALERLAAASARDELSYAPVLVTASTDSIAGYRRAEWSVDLGRGIDVFERGAEALLTWQMHQRSGLSVGPLDPPAVGAVVAVAAPLPLGFIEAVCRVVACEDSDHRRGFTYGTLPHHPEQGEESFTVELDVDERVRFDIVAVSRPHHPLARAVPPIARRLQERAIRRYLAAMQSLSGR